LCGEKSIGFILESNLLLGRSFHFRKAVQLTALSPTTAATTTMATIVVLLIPDLVLVFLSAAEVELDPGRVCWVVVKMVDIPDEVGANDGTNRGEEVAGTGIVVGGSDKSVGVAMIGAAEIEELEIETMEADEVEEEDAREGTEEDSAAEVEDTVMGLALDVALDCVVCESTVGVELLVLTLGLVLVLLVLSTSLLVLVGAAEEDEAMLDSTADEVAIAADALASAAEIAARVSLLTGAPARSSTTAMSRFESSKRRARRRR